MSSSFSPRYLSAVRRIAGTGMPRKISPSPYSPLPVLKYRATCRARSASPAAFSSRSRSALACFLSIAAHIVYSTAGNTRKPLSCPTAMARAASVLQRIFGPETGPESGSQITHLFPRWIFLRALGLIYFSAFYSLLFQIRGLIGPDGILPAHQYFQAVERSFPGTLRLWFAPSLFWVSSSNHALMLVTIFGLICSLSVVANIWPRLMLFICFVCFLSFVTAAEDFSNYQSDGMLLEAGFISLFFAPRGFWPGLGAASAPSRASQFLILWEWFRIYFESGLVKLLSGDPEWRHFTAMDEYYQNGPLPTWIGWYIQHLPHWFHAFTVGATLFMELALVFMLFLPRRFRIACFFIVTPMQISIILTANYAFLNYLVLALGVLLLDDAFLMRFLPARWPAGVRENLSRIPPEPEAEPAIALKLQDVVPTSQTSAENPPAENPRADAPSALRSRVLSIASAAKLWIAGLLLAWLLYANAVLLTVQVFRTPPIPPQPATALEPFRIANSYGLFGRMTWARCEIEFQGSSDGVTWVAYPFRYKPQDVREAPGIYAPYQPRFEWNLWFGSLSYWRENPFVIRTEQALLENDADVLALFRSNPFAGRPPRQVRAILWQYWFTDLATKRATGAWWRREEKGLYAPALERGGDGKIFVFAWPESLPPPP